MDPTRTGLGAKVTWLGHASAVIELGGQRVLVDPLGRRRARSAGRVDAILVTHAHVDHLNRWTLAGLDRDTHLVVPRGAAAVVADLGFAHLTEVGPGDDLSIGGLDIAAVPTRHDSGRWRKPRGSRTATDCAGYVVMRDGHAVHHSGDVDFSDHAVFDELGRRFRLDATLLPIGGMLPVWYYRWRRGALDRGVHIDPDAALAIAERLGAAAMVPVHWGTVNLRLGPPSMAPKRLVHVAQERGVDRLVRVLAHGEALDLEPLARRGVAASDASVLRGGNTRAATGSQMIGDAAGDADHADQDPDHRAEDAVADERVAPVLGERTP